MNSYRFLEAMFNIPCAACLSSRSLDWCVTEATPMLVLAFAFIALFIAVPVAVMSGLAGLSLIEALCAAWGIELAADIHIYCLGVVAR